MWELDHKEGWAPKKWCFQIMVLEKTLESPLNLKKIKPVNPKGNQSWLFIGRTDAEVETPVLWPPDGKDWLIGKDPDAGKDWRWEEKATTEDEMVGWHHWLNGHEFEQALRDGERQRSLACFSQWWSQRVGPELATEQHVFHVSFFSSFSHTSHCLQLLHWGFTSYFQKASGKSDDMSHPESWWGLWLGCYHVSALWQEGQTCWMTVSPPVNHRLGRLCLLPNVQIIIWTREGKLVWMHSLCTRMSRAPR